jgi:hypothetical protein
MEPNYPISYSEDLQNPRVGFDGCKYALAPVSMACLCSGVEFRAPQVDLVISPHQNPVSDYHQVLTGLFSSSTTTITPAIGFNSSVNAVVQHHRLNPKQRDGV